MRLATGYQASQALHVAASLGLADLLAGAPRSSDELAAATNTHAPSLRRLLRALAAFGVFREEEDGCFALAPPGECLRADLPGSARPLVLMWGHEDFRRTWDALEHCVRTGETAAKHLFGSDDAFARYAADPGLGAAFNAGMTVMSAATADAVVAAYDFSGARLVVDVGGGHGRLIAAVLSANPSLRGVLFDLPSVVRGATGLLAQARVADRCRVLGGDMFAAVPEGGDLYLLKSVIHDWDDGRALAVLANCRRAMQAPGSRLLLVERLLPERMEPTPAARSHALGDLNMLVRTGGLERTEGEFRKLLDEAGLRLVRVLPTSSHLSLIEAAST